MVRCYIDGQEAIPKLTDTIKVTRQNYFIKDTEAFTYDVTFPMQIAQNRRVLGNLQRMEVSKTAAKFANCQLIADNITVISGRGTVTSVTDTEVKVQIKTGSDDDDEAVGGRYPEAFYLHTTAECRAAASWQQGESTTYFPVDADDPTTVFPLPSLTILGDPTGSIPTLDGATTLYTPTIARIMEQGYMGAKEWAIFPPLYNASADKFYNVLGRSATYVVDTSGDTTVWHTQSDDEAIFNPLPCWSLARAVKEMVGVVGYTATGGFFEDELVAKLYIACPTKYPTGKVHFPADLDHWRRLSSYVPRWKLSTFLNELANLLNLQYTFDTTAKTVRIELATRLTTSTAAEDAYTQFEPLDEFSTEYDEDGAEYIAATNIAYDIENDNDTRYFHTLTDELRESFPVADYADAAAVKAAYAAMDDTTRRQTIFHCPTNYYYAHTEEADDGTETTTLDKCARFAPIIRDEASDTKTALSIVPTPWTVQPFPSFHHTQTTVKGFCSLTEATVSIGLPTLTEEESDTEETATVQSVMEGEADAPSEQGEDSTTLTIFAFEPQAMKAAPSATAIVEQGWNASSGVKKAGYPSTVPLAGCAFIDGDLYREGDHAPYTSAQLAQIGRTSLALTSTPCELYVGAAHASTATIGSEATALVDTHTKVTIKFLADELPVATKPYVFHGKKYVAEKIEIEIKNGKVSPVKTGYFYEVKG